MKPGQASKTAEFNALFRAIESSRRPRRKRLFEDPFAPGFLSRLGRAYLQVSRLPLVGRLIPWYIDTKWPGVWPSAIGRTCWIDDQLRAALKEGITQVVILGVGYDCRAYRIPGIERARVFEIDHPNTLATKVERLTHLLGSIPGNVTFVEVDFNRQDFAAVLRNSGFDQAVSSFFLWEGVVHYLIAEAVDLTLRSIASLSAPGSRLVFTYIHRGLLDGSVAFGDLRSIPGTLNDSGERWTFGFHPDELASYLAERGLRLVTDVGSIDYRKQYLGRSGSHLKGFEFYRVALAEVGGYSLSDQVFVRQVRNTVS
jgi:methyltransferase (TIGR00027 family)